MPISPDNMKLYPGGSARSPEWLAIRAHIRAHIRARAGDCCEDCGVKNGDIGYRDEQGKFHGGYMRHKPGAELVIPHLGGWCTFPIAIKIVCTVAHLDHDPTHNDESNLRFLCQRCHNRYDAAHRKANRARSRKALPATERPTD